MIELYDKTTIHLLPWEQCEEGAYAKRFLLPLILHGPDTYIQNVKTTLYVLRVDQWILPVTVSEVEAKNCYVCSPYAFYGGFTGEKVDKLQNPILRTGLKPLVATYKEGLRQARLDKIVLVNNWLLATNLYPPFEERQVAQIRDLLIERFPSHAIGFRSINPYDNSRSFETLTHCHFKMMAARPVYFVDTHDPDHYKSRMFRSDLKILESTSYEIIENRDVQDTDIPRLVELYRMLYVDKYSSLNPELTPKFIELIIKEDLLTVKLLRKEGRIDAMMGYYERNGVVTSPLFGYDTSLPQELGLYRMISCILSLEAKKRGALLNMSAGAGSYKTLRRAKANIESIAIYTDHLRFPRRLPWLLLRTLINRVGAPLMLKLDH